MEIQDAKQARPHCELIAELLDSRQPKTEREHAAEREIERLRHDIERHIAIASELATENERLTSALTDILNPLGRMQREAAANGCRLNGMAVHLMNDAQYLKEIAKEALATPSKESK